MRHLRCLKNKEPFARNEYLCTLQPRRKWHDEKPNMKKGDVVLMKDCNTSRNDWPTGIIEETLPSRDGKVRKVVVRVAHNGKLSTYTRHITEIVLLISS